MCQALGKENKDLKSNFFSSSYLTYYEVIFLLNAISRKNSLLHSKKKYH